MELRVAGQYDASTSTSTSTGQYDRAMRRAKRLHAQPGALSGAPQRRGMQQLLLLRLPPPQKLGCLTCAELVTEAES